jgi:hypothetical protein
LTRALLGSTNRLIAVNVPRTEISPDIDPTAKQKALWVLASAAHGAFVVSAGSAHHFDRVGAKNRNEGWSGSKSQVASVGAAEFRPIPRASKPAGRPVAVAQHAAESFSALKPADGTPDLLVFVDQSIVETLLISFRVMVSQELDCRPSKRRLSEEDHALQAPRLQAPHEALQMGVQVGGRAGSRTDFTPASPRVERLSEPSNP